MLTMYVQNDVAIIRFTDKLSAQKIGPFPYVESANPRFSFFCEFKSK